MATALANVRTQDQTLGSCTLTNLAARQLQNWPLVFLERPQLRRLLPSLASPAYTYLSSTHEQLPEQRTCPTNPSSLPVLPASMNSPPPSDGLVPPSSPATENTEPLRMKRKAVLTPRKFNRFFTPRSQASTQPQPALQPLPESILNVQPESSHAPPSDPHHTPLSPNSVLASSPLNPSIKRKRTSPLTRPATSNASSSRSQATEPTTPRAERAPSARTQHNDIGADDNRASPLVLHRPYSGPAYLTSVSQTIAPVPLDFGRDRPTTPAVVGSSAMNLNSGRNMIC